MTSDSNIKLSLVKEQVEKMFETLHSLDANEKCEAFGYLRKYLDGDGAAVDSKTDTLIDVTSVANVNSDKKPNKREVSFSKNATNSIETQSKRVRNGNRKIKFTNHMHLVKKSVLKCRICGIPNKTKSLLLRHLECHVGTPISCVKCKKDFNNRSSYLCHLSLKMCKRSTNVMKRFVCPQCQKTFRFKRHFERHMEGHKRNNCTYCDARLTRRKQLVHHLLTAHSIKLERAVLFKCEFCEKRYVKKRSLYHHLKQHADNKIVCMECGWMSSTLDDHFEHFVKHDKDRPWKCEKCNDRFSRRQQYLIHMKRHDRYKCVTCSESFASKVHVLRHKQRGHAVQGLEPQMKCPHCPMAFQRRLSLQMHMRKHSDDKSMFCKYCDKTFRSPYLYFKHCTSTMHDTNSPEKQQLVCEICGKLFVKKYLLEQHLHRVHNHMKQPYVCDFCSHKTTNRKNMERHLSLHLEDKKECVCDKCGKAFYNLTTLKDHVSYVHSQERHFKCTQCDKAFKRNSELIRHKTSHSELRPHVCQICGVSYKRSTHLRRHEESQHGTITKNRRVQRLTKDVNGALIPVPEELKKKDKNKKKPTTDIAKQVFSVMDTQSGEMVTFSIPQTSHNADITTVFGMTSQGFTTDILQNVDFQYQDMWQEKPNKNQSLVNTDMILTNEFVNQTMSIVDSIDQNFTAHLLNAQPFPIENEIASTFVNRSVLQEAPKMNTVTCDMLIPDRIANQPDKATYANPTTNDYMQNPYHFL